MTKGVYFQGCWLCGFVIRKIIDDCPELSNISGYQDKGHLWSQWGKHQGSVQAVGQHKNISFALRGFVGIVHSSGPST